MRTEAFPTLNELREAAEAIRDVGRFADALFSATSEEGDELVAGRALVQKNTTNQGLEDIGLSLSDIRQVVDAANLMIRLTG